MKLTPAQEQRLRWLFDDDPQLRLWSDVLRDDGKGRNPTFRILADLGLITYTCIAGNSFRAVVTVKGIQYLHGEKEEPSNGK